MCLLSIPTSASDLLQRATYKRVHGYTHVIYQHTLLDGSKCSATAIGPHALLTASHCEQATSKITIDDNDEPSKILNVIRDEQDHTIYIVGDTFKEYAVISVVPPVVGDDVFMFGNPGKKTNIFRKGYVVYTRGVSVSLFSVTPAFVAYDLNGFEGDSGAGIFNDSGELVGVVSVADIEVDEKDKTFTMKLMVCPNLAFTADQLKESTK